MIKGVLNEFGFLSGGCAPKFWSFDLRCGACDESLASEHFGTSSILNEK